MSGKAYAARKMIDREMKYEEVVDSDNGIRSDTTAEKLAALKPVFDRRYGSVTAGNASPLTDGASAVLLMSEERAKELGYEPLGYIRSYAYASLSPAEAAARRKPDVFIRLVDGAWAMARKIHPDLFNGR